MPKTIKILLPDHGFSFISLLISLVIIGILAATALTYYKQMGIFGKDRTNPASVTRKLDLDLTKNTMRQINIMEGEYHVRYNRYANFADLQRDGVIPGGYTAKLEKQGKPYLNYWDIQIQAKADSYTLIATPNALAAGFEGVPILAMNETGRIWEEEGYDSSASDDESTDEEPPDNTLPEGATTDGPPPDDTSNQ